MTPEQRIEKYYLERLKMYHCEVNDAITTILGDNFKKLLDGRKKFFYLVFVASQGGLEYYFGETNDKKKREIIEFLLDKAEEEEKEFTLINKDFPLEKGNKKFYEWLQDKRVFCNTYEQVVIGYLKLDIFNPARDGLLQDIGYIRYLLIHLMMEYKNGVWCEPKRFFELNEKTENENKKIYDYILATVAIQIVALLRKKNIYILDDMEEFDEEKVNGYVMVHPKFIAAFQDLLPLFLLKPEKFIDIVGINNFRDFTICTLNGNSSDDIEEIINRMLIERERKAIYEFKLINAPLIMKAKQKLEAEKKGKLETSEDMKQTDDFSNRLNNSGDNIYNDNIKKEEHLEYIDPDDLPPRRR